VSAIDVVVCPDFAGPLHRAALRDGTMSSSLTIPVAAWLLVLAMLGSGCDRGAPETGSATDPLPIEGSVEGVNLVWFVIDAQRADHLGCYGYEKDTSPFIDDFAARGILFRNAMAQESYTQASVPSFFTSTYPVFHRVLYDNPRIDVLDPELDTIAEILAREDYFSAAFVFNPHLKSKFGFGQGFDVYDDNPAGFDDRLPRHQKYETARRIHDKVAGLLQEVEARPLFLYLHYRDVHSPYAPPPPYHEKYFPAGYDPDETLPLLEKPDRSTVDLHLSQYDGEIRYTDDVLRETVELLERHGIRTENSIFIITSDHGEEFFDPHPDDAGGIFHGRTLHREQMRVPLILSLPGVQPARRVFDSYVELVDIVPTIVDLLGIDTEAHEQLQGRSLLPMIESGSEPPRRIYAGGNHGRGALIEAGWKYYRNDAAKKADRSAGHIQPAPGQELSFREELYDVVNDPEETRNLIADQPQIASRLREALAAVERRFSRPGSDRTIDLDRMTKEQLEALGYIEEPEPSR
jgi:arylsulfatase A-like enzyme